MHTQVFFSSHLTHITFFIFITFSTSQAQDDEQFSECRNHTYSCGQSVQSIGYPFWGNGRPQFCGHPQFELKCQNNDYPIIVIDTHTFRVLDINQSMHTMTMARSDLWNESDDHCPQTFRNITLNNNTLFGYAPTVRNLNIYYGCIPNVTISKYNLTLAGVQSSFSCEVDGFRESGGFYADESFSRIQLENCTSCEIGIEVPILRTSLDGLWNGSVKLQEALNLGFEVVYNSDNFECSICEASDGICGSDSTSNQFVCLCCDQPYSQVCRNHEKKINLGVKLAIGFGAAGGSILLMCLIFFFYQRRNKNHYAASSLVSRNISSYTSSMRDLEKESTCLGVQMFSYGELEEATNNFDSKEELGDGGFGTVYKGKLRDGRVVAVKRLYENNYKRVEQFLNEVEILTRLRHQNLVSLYGCTSRHCRELLLVYEYIPNGTVADHLHGERAKPGSLAWSTRMSIAIETASALTYLHASDIIHRDVKTTNILLDNNFSVKVADFGLSRLFPIDVTHISTAPQGTPGYVDPEYHECYHLTDKSDVYSFGVVLAELISSKPAVDITRHRHEINLSNLAINKIKNQALHELVDPCIGFESDYKVRKMITDVAELVFQCLQSEREMRPSMQEVLEALQRIQSDGCDVKKAEDVDIPADDVVLLKSDSATLSPDSVTAKWISRSTTPNASG